jgi:hypothetical protein
VRNYIIAAAVMCLSACSSTSTAPSIKVPALSTTAKATTKSSPSVNGVVFDPAQLGHVTINNTSDTTDRFTFIVWNATDPVNQVNVAQSTASIDAGGTKDITVGFPETCGTKYQRDVYLNLPDNTGKYTLSDVGNYLFAAPGIFWVEASCDIPPVVPTPPVLLCQDREANNYHGPLPCTFGEGNQPPVDVCPNLEGLQLTLPYGYHFNEDHQCVKNPPPCPEGYYRPTGNEDIPYGCIPIPVCYDFYFQMNQGGDNKQHPDGADHDDQTVCQNRGGSWLDEWHGHSDVCKFKTRTPPGFEGHDLTFLDKVQVSCGVLIID